MEYNLLMMPNNVCKRIRHRVLHSFVRIELMRIKLGLI
jgi:hypothetical protein